MDRLVVLLGELAETERHLDGDRGLGVHGDYTKRLRQAQQRTAAKWRICQQTRKVKSEKRGTSRPGEGKGKGRQASLTSANRRKFDTNILYIFHS